MARPPLQKGDEETPLLPASVRAQLVRELSDAFARRVPRATTLTAPPLGESKAWITAARFAFLRALLAVIPDPSLFAKASRARASSAPMSPSRALAAQQKAAQQMRQRGVQPHEPAQETAEIDEEALIAATPATRRAFVRRVVTRTQVCAVSLLHFSHSLSLNAGACSSRMLLTCFRATRRAPTHAHTAPEPFRNTPRAPALCSRRQAFSFFKDLSLLRGKHSEWEHVRAMRDVMRACGGGCSAGGCTKRPL